MGNAVVWGDMVEEGVRPDDSGSQDSMAGMEGVPDDSFEMPPMPDKSAERPSGPHTPLETVPPDPEQMQALMKAIHAAEGTSPIVEQSSSVTPMPEQIHAVPEQPSSQHNTNYSNDPIERVVQVVTDKIKYVWVKIKAFFTGGPRQPQPMPV